LVYTNFTLAPRKVAVGRVPEAGGGDRLELYGRLYGAISRIQRDKREVRAR
jgi:hypothetical protein